LTSGNFGNGKDISPSPPTIDQQLLKENTNPFQHLPSFLGSETSNPKSSPKKPKIAPVDQIIFAEDGSPKIPKRFAFYGSILLGRPGERPSEFSHKDLRNYLKTREPNIEILSFGSGRIYFDKWESSQRFLKAIDLKPITVVSDNIRPEYAEDFENVKKVFRDNDIEIWSNSQFRRWIDLKMHEWMFKKRPKKEKPKKTSKRKEKKKMKKKVKKMKKKISQTNKI
jgi:hypothetical protein